MNQDDTQASLTEETLNRLFGKNRNADIIIRPLSIAGIHAVLYYFDGLLKDDVLERVIQGLQQTVSQLPDDADRFLESCVSYGECSVEVDETEIYRSVSTGCAALFCACFQGCVIIKARSTPQRGIEEPQNDKVLRGPKMGFLETLVPNLAMLRRHIRDRHFIIETITVGSRTKTQIAVCYLEGTAKAEHVERILTRLRVCSTASVSMGAQSVSELLIRKNWYNPFPKFRYTERPDTAAASLLEGCVIVLTDNSPQAIILPVSIFDFMQQAEDFYMPPAVGSYLKIVRLLTFFTGLYLTPIWFLLQKYAWILPTFLQFILPHEPCAVPILVQLLLIELAIDGLRLASLNTPDPLTNSLSVVGGLILGDFAVEVGWFLPMTILYAAIVGIANFIQQSYELGYATKFCRIAMLLLTGAFGIYGFILANLLMLLLLVTNETVDGRGRYFYPLIPFDGRACLSLLLRHRKMN